MKKPVFPSLGKNIHYDLPLHKDEGTQALTLLVALMSFLSVIVISGSLALGGLAGHWTSGLENKITIEIPAEDAAGQARDENAISALQKRIADFANKQNGVYDAHIIDRADTAALLRPWLGDATALSDLPIPGLVAVEIRKPKEADLDRLKTGLKTIDPAANFESQKQWLSDLLHLAGALRFAAALTIAVIAVSTAAAITNSMRARMAVHRPDIELLHYIGASDRYIARQFQNHAMMLALKGGVIGTICGAMMLCGIVWLMGDVQHSLLPGAQISLKLFLFIALLPFFACLIGAVTARMTVLKTLARMP